MSHVADGDTTDSMDEEDMPILDDPALAGLMEQEVPDTRFGFAVNGSSARFPSPFPLLGQFNVHLPSLGDPSGSRLRRARAVPMMGTFHSPPDDSARHAVIDGSRTRIKSIFTRRRFHHLDRRSTSAYPPASSGSTRPLRARNHPPTPASSGSTRPIRARHHSPAPGFPWSSLPRRPAPAAPSDRQTAPSESNAGPMVLEDMLDTSVLLHEHEESSDPQYRFDRVPVSAYFRRCLSSLGPWESTNDSPMRPSLSSQNGIRSGSLSDTLAGPLRFSLNSSPILSPIANPEHEMIRRAKQRAKRDRREREIAWLNA